LDKFYAVRWYDSEYYTSVNTIEYVFDMLSKSRPIFYTFLVYDLIETPLSIKELNTRLPFDKNYNRVSVNKLHCVEKAKLKYHLRKLREYLDNPPMI
jgi:hypothetical protein